jgi:hypothetical protein
MHHGEYLENILWWKFVMDDGVCSTLYLCCEIYTHMNDSIVQHNIFLICKTLKQHCNYNKRTNKY